ncbi:MAG: chemotaxis-specific protein-glutamate methyltransferase CheB [Chloroflexota bacterium]
MFPASATFASSHVDSELTTQTVRVLVVDRSAYTRFTLSKSLRQTPGITVAGLAQNGEEALAMIPQVRPHVITLDAQAPHHDGLSTLRTLMVRYPLPVVILSNLNRESTHETVEALTCGAIDFVAKPSARTNVATVIVELIAKIRTAALARVLPATYIEPAHVDAHKPKHPRPLRKQDKVVVIGASLGGPRSLQRLLMSLPAEIPATFVIVQHLQNGFTESLAKQLDDVSPLAIKEAQLGDTLKAGAALLAPGGLHLTLDDNHLIVLNKSNIMNGVRPSVDVTMSSVARRYGDAAMGVILSGTGTDGVNGAAMIRKFGGRVIVEDEASSTMFELPHSVRQAGQADLVVPIEEMANALIKMINE